MELAGAGRNESLHKAFRVLAAISRSQGASVDTAEVVAMTGMPRSTVLRILGSLFDLGAVSRLPDRTWMMGPTIGQLASATSPIVQMKHLVREQLEAITARVEETSMIGIAVGDAAVRILDEVEGSQLLSVRSRWSDRVIDHSASGFVRALMAESPTEVVRARLERMEHHARTPSTKTRIDDLVDAIDTIRREGYSEVVNELETGIAGVGVPVRHNGAMIAQLAVYLPSVRLDSEKRRAILAELHRAAGVLQDAVGSNFVA